MVQFTGRLVALRESSSPSTSVRHVGRRFSPYPYSIFYYKSGCDASDPSLPGPSLLAPLVHRSCLLLLPSINSMPCIPSKRARVLALHLSLPGRWPAPALGMRHSRAGTAVAQRFDFEAQRFDFCAGHGNLFFPPTHPTTQGICAGGIGGWFLAASFGFGLAVVLAFWSSPRPSLCVRSSCCLLQLLRALLVLLSRTNAATYQRYYSSSRVARRKLYLACLGIW